MYSHLTSAEPSQAKLPAFFLAEALVSLIAAYQVRIQLVISSAALKCKSHSPRTQGICQITILMYQMSNRPLLLLTRVSVVNLPTIYHTILQTCHTTSYRSSLRLWLIPIYHTISHIHKYHTIVTCILFMNSFTLTLLGFSFLIQDQPLI